MLSVQKSLQLALVAAIALVAAETQAAPYVFGKEPVARHNRAVAARRTQATMQYRTTMQTPTRTYANSNYGGTAMVQTYPVPQRSTVTPVAGYRPQMAANSGAVVR